jgi:hypothetical protein
MRIKGCKFKLKTLKFLKKKSNFDAKIPLFKFTAKNLKNLISPSLVYLTLNMNERMCTAKNTQSIKDCKVSIRGKKVGPVF